MEKAEIITLKLPYPDRGEKTVRVYLPEREEGETFPVIYMTDGQNLFDEQPGMFGCWHTREAVSAERQKSSKAAIIVGIHNDEHFAVRGNQLTPKTIGRFFYPPDIPDEIKKMFNPEGEVFDDFVVNMVMPVIKAKFPVKKGREFTAFCGSSSGGLESMFIALSHPDKFGSAGVFSPCFMMYEPEDFFNWLGSHIGEIPPFIYLYSGGDEGIETEIRNCVEAAGAFLQKSYPADKLKLVIKPENKHHESAWEIEFKEFLHIFLNQ